MLFEDTNNSFNYHRMPHQITRELRKLFLCFFYCLNYILHILSIVFNMSTVPFTPSVPHCNNININGNLIGTPLHVTSNNRTYKIEDHNYYYIMHTMQGRIQNLGQEGLIGNEKCRGKALHSVCGPKLHAKLGGMLPETNVDI